MDCYRIVLVLIVAAAIASQKANALSCYHCSSTEPDKSCFDPINVKEVPSYTCDKNNSDVVRVMGRSLDVTADVVWQCGLFEAHHNSENKTEVARLCYPKMNDIKFCSYMDIKAMTEKFNLTKCVECESDNCNGPEVGSGGSSQHSPALVSVFLCLAALTHFSCN